MIRHAAPYRIVNSKIVSSKTVNSRKDTAMLKCMTKYCPTAVNAAIASSNRAGRKIGKREARLIHALLKGRT